MTSVAWTRLGSLFRRAALPLGCYYTVTLLMPLANGAAHSGGAFVHHALVVLVVPPALILAGGLTCATIGMLTRTRIEVSFPSTPEERRRIGRQRHS